ncbi:MAG: homoserine dehydrogenase [Desulfobacteraceae bacterium]|nr:MAG: homoserine dehydrogenase [Desulfobacteraceae bacterium]
MKKRLILCGFGNVGRTFGRMIEDRREMVRMKYGLDLEIAAVVDIGGAAVAKEGALPLDRLLRHVENGGPVESLEGFGFPGISGQEVLSTLNAEVLVETTPTNLKDGEPGRRHITAALNSGLDVVSANKGPLVLYFRQLMDLASEKGRRIMMSAATAAALPSLDVGLLCLAGARVLAIEGILNGTTNFILTRMRKEGCSYEAALREAQKMGIAETDPSLDVEGYDTRNKLVLIANRIFDKNFGTADVAVSGICGISGEDIERAGSLGKVLKLVGSAEFEENELKLRVEPRALDPDHPLSSIDFSEKGISYLTDTMGRVTVTGGKSSPVGAAAALLKDLIHLSILR